MTKEERELRKMILRRWDLSNRGATPGKLGKQITAMRKAIYEDAAKVANEHTHFDHLGRDDGCQCAEVIAAAIREGK